MTATIRESEIALAILPQDPTGKSRPVLVLKKMPGRFDDFLVCAISTQLHQEINGFDEVLTPDADNGLRATSLVRLGSLAIMTAAQIKGSIGELTAAIHKRLLNRLASHLVC